jgi:hypothetical protein
MGTWLPLTCAWTAESYLQTAGPAAATGNGEILIRDTTNRDGATLRIPAAAWQRFTDALK